MKSAKTQKTAHTGPIKKTISIILIVVLIANMLLFAFRKVDTLVFWAIIIVCAIGTFYVKRIEK